MSLIRILTKNGVDNLNTDGARSNNFNAGRRSGIVKGALNEGRLFAISNDIVLDTCELRLCGHRVVIEEPESRGVNDRPSVDQRLSLIAQINVDDDRNVEFSMFVKNEDEPLVQNNLDIDGTGTYQLEIGTFVQTTDGRLINILRTADLITGGLDTGESQYWEVGDVETTQVPYNVKADVDIDFNEDTRKYDFHFQIPRGQAGLDGSGTNPNLLINGDFRVNQRGQSSYSGTGYTVDGWYNGGNLTIVPNNGSISVINNDSSLRWFKQYTKYSFEDFAGKTLTISAKVNGQTYSATGVIPSIKPSSGTVLINASVIALRFANDRYEYCFSVPASETFLIEYAKLEIGSVATPFSPKPYEEELAACQIDETWNKKFTGGISIVSSSSDTGVSISRISSTDGSGIRITF